MGRFARRALSSAAIVLGAASARAGSYVYAPIVVGTGDTTKIQPLGINASDVVVGTQTSYTRVGHTTIETYRGFIWRNGVATLFGAPRGATFVSSVGIDRYGVVLALDTLADGTPGTFTYNTVSGRDRQLSVASATSLHGLSIGNRGTIAGTATVAGSSVVHSFVIANGTATVFDPPGAISSQATAVAADGTVVGTFYVGDPNMRSGYVYKDGAFTILDDPAAVGFGDVKLTFPTYVGPRGTIVGSYSNQIPLVGFEYKDGVYTTLPDGYNVLPLRTLDDGRVFGVAEYENNFVGYVTDGTGFHYVIAPGAFDMGITSVNGRGDFVGQQWLLDGYHPYIARCPVGQAPCD